MIIREEAASDIEQITATPQPLSRPSPTAMDQNLPSSRLYAPAATSLSRL